MEKIHCNECKRELGNCVTVPGSDIEFLQLGGVLLRKAHGVCPHCGAAFYWSVSDQQLERLVRLVENMHTDMLQ